METVLQGLVGLSCLFLAGLGARTMFTPKSMIGILAVEPDGPAGLNTMRGFLGGLILGSSILLATGLATAEIGRFLAEVGARQQELVPRRHSFGHSAACPSCDALPRRAS